jgi:hypothetical protein
MKTEDLIHRLSADLTPIRRLPSPRHRLVLWLAVSLPCLMAIALLFGLRPDLAQCLTDQRFLIGNAAALLTGIAAAWAALATTVPGFSRKAVLGLPLAPALVWLISAGEGCWRQWQLSGWSGLDSILHQKCLPEIIGTGLVPALALIVLSRRGAGLHPGLTAGLAALAAAAIGSAALSLFHGGDTAWVTLTWHVGGAGLISALAALAGPRLFRHPASFPPA